MPSTVSDLSWFSTLQKPEGLFMIGIKLKVQMSFLLEEIEIHQLQELQEYRDNCDYGIFYNVEIQSGVLEYNTMYFN